MKTLLLLGSLLALLVLGGCTKEPEEVKGSAPPTGVNQGTAAAQGQARPAGAVSNQ